MALRKPFTLENKIALPSAYFKIAPFLWTQGVEVTDEGVTSRVVGNNSVLVYADEAARREGRNPILEIIEVPNQALRAAVIGQKNRDAALTRLYNWLKTLPRYEGADDV